MKRSIKRIFNDIYFCIRSDYYYSRVPAPFSNNIETDFGNILEIKRVQYDTY